ncbi:MAG: helix-turn-helix domain-containing protein [Polaribacter sp.]|uniref:helix-turn-helix domain-containing protein n=1 Tax=Polaribacter sp. TaxID=1920175 RepID=UPI002F360948
MESKEPSYYSILPAPVRYDKRLTPNAKILFAEITSLTNQLGFCYATNRYFENLYKVSTQSINFWLKQLEEFGYIERHLYRDKGTKEILNRYITIFDKPIQVNFNRPIQDIFKDNNKLLNNKPNPLCI